MTHCQTGSCCIKNTFVFKKIGWSKKSNVLTGKLKGVVLVPLMCNRNKLWLDLESLLKLVELSLSEQFNHFHFYPSLTAVFQVDAHLLSYRAMSCNWGHFQFCMQVRGWLKSQMTSCFNDLMDKAAGGRQTEEPHTHSVKKSPVCRF